MPIGSGAGYEIITGSYNIEIGNPGATNDNGIIRIGTQGTQTNTFIAGISGATAASGVAVYINPSGQLGTLTSSARFKTNIASMDDASDVLLSLHPVKFKYKDEIDPQHIPQFGLVAEEVDKVDPDLVARDDKNQIYTVRYEAVNAMLLNEFLKEHRQVQAQKTEIHDLQQRLESLEKIVLNQKSN
jgi:Chaperone of endosialidase